MQPPIILNENGDITVFDSVRSAEEYVEPIDVENNEYVAYDRTGRRLHLQVATSRGRNYPVELIDSPDGKVVPDELAGVLRGYLRALGAEQGETDCLPLEQLIQLARTIRRKIK